MSNKSKIFIVALCLIVLFSVLYINVQKEPKYPVQTDHIHLNEGVNLNEGRKMTQAICMSCHFNPQTNRLSGVKHGNPSKFGDIYSANITKDSVFGIGTWTDEELVYFLRTGIRRDGSYVFDMPKYSLLSDNDIYSVIAFLRSDDELVQPIHSNIGETKYSFLTKVLVKYFFKPAKWIAHVPDIDKRDTITWGKYISTVKYSCANCHSGNNIFYNNLRPEKSWRYFKGGDPHYDENNNEIITPSLRPVERYSRAEFIDMVKYGFRKDTIVLRRPMIPFSMLDDDEVNAIYVYLQSLDKDENY
ncbi:MAG: cytochrome c [Chitinophagales bacterium]|nr:cytochrome c [Chitinophagales bacterium]